MTAIVELSISAPVQKWQHIGLTVVDNIAQVGGVRMRFVPGAGGVEGGVVGGVEDGVVAWGLADLPVPCTHIDGLSTYPAAYAASDLSTLRGGDGGALGATEFDHLVVMTSSLDRTCAAIESATGEPLKRIREAGAIRQGFHRLGEVIVEVVESSAVVSPEAAFWGFVWNVVDIHEVCSALGPDVISLPKPAVQQGRFIATFRPSLGLGVALAIMSAPVQREPRS